MNKSGPRIEPWGTPILHILVVICVCFIEFDFKGKSIVQHNFMLNTVKLLAEIAVNKPVKLTCVLRVIQY